MSRDLPTNDADADVAEPATKLNNGTSAPKEPLWICTSGMVSGGSGESGRRKRLADEEDCPPPEVPAVVVMRTSDPGRELCSEDPARRSLPDGGTSPGILAEVSLEDAAAVELDAVVLLLIRLCALEGRVDIVAMLCRRDYSHEVMCRKEGRITRDRESSNRTRS